MNKAHEYLIKHYIHENHGMITKELAESIVHSMIPTEDGIEIWSCKEAKDLGNKMNVDWNVIPLEHWYIVLNMMHCDYSRTATKYGLNDTFYGDLALDWFMDADAEEDKTVKYFLWM